MTGLRERIPPMLDIGIALAAAVFVSVGTFGAATYQPAARPPDAVTVSLTVLAALALAWRRRAPVAMLASVVAVVCGYLLIGYPYGPIQLCMVFAMFELARQRGLRTSLLACGVSVLVVMAVFTAGRLLGGHDVTVQLVGAWTGWLIVPWSVGALVHVRTAATKRERRELAARAALEERMRVARDVHDIAGHGFSAVAMQAGVALVVFDEQPKQAKESLEAIQATSAKALSDLRTMLDAFHRQATEPVDTQGLRDLDALVDTVRAGGLPVRLSREDVTVSEGTDRAAYRVVQEALTNALRHAGPTTADVDVHRDGDTLVVDVRDSGVGADNVTPGRGLAGMRERVAAVGGELTAGSRAAGGFQVLARLPISEGDA
ncbi:MAG: sensor histidine kinase [Pseudonocardiaceae bacterium]|nr:sensor histidine kinase [Pseudonocardiaceae bacterium]